MKAQRNRTRRQTTSNASSAYSIDDSTRPSFSEMLSNPCLATLWLGDVAMALSVTVAVAPALTAVDKAIVEQSAAGSRNVMLHSMRQTALSILSNPVAYYRSPTFGWMSLTYIATYTTANVIKTWNAESDRLAVINKEKYRSRRGAVVPATPPPNTVSNDNGTVLVAATTFANSAASLVKDRAYARMFGQIPKPVPSASYVAWLSRDAFGIGSGFVLPAHVAPHVQSYTGWSTETSAAAAQMGTPVLAQTIAGPLHLCGLTIYNATPQDSFATKLQNFSRSVVSVTLARMLRFLPGYGIAGVMNQKGRTWWKQQVYQHEAMQHEANNKVWRERVLTVSRATTSRMDL